MASEIVDFNRRADGASKVTVGCAVDLQDPTGLMVSTISFTCHDFPFKMR